MSDVLPNIDQLDPDGALRESADRVDGHTRAGFMRRAGAFVGAGAVAGMVPGGVAMAQGGLAQSDTAILNFALTLEYLEAAFYKEAVDNGSLSGETRTFAKVVADHESQHVAALKKVLGSDAVKRPSFGFKGTTSDQSLFQQTAITLEDTGVRAYLGQTPNIKSKTVLKSAASILPVEAWHAGWIREIVGRGSAPVPAPTAADTPATIPQTLAAVQATGFVQSMLPALPGAPLDGAPGVAG